MEHNLNFTPEQISTFDRFKKIIERVATPDTKASIKDNYIDEYGTHVCEVVGGLNGNGIWDKYLKCMADILKEARNLGIRVWLIDGKNDCLDDVFVFRFGIKNDDEMVIMKPPKDLHLYKHNLFPGYCMNYKFDGDTWNFPSKEVEDAIKARPDDIYKVWYTDHAQYKPVNGINLISSYTYNVVYVIREKKVENNK